MTDLPPPGPERDRLVAEALGYDEPDVAEAPEPYTSRTTHPNGAWHWHHGERRWLAMPYSTYNHAALDALEAWKRGGKGRTVTIILDSSPDAAYVNLGWPPDHWKAASAPTLGDAASAAIIEAKRRDNA